MVITVSRTYPPARAWPQDIHLFTQKVGLSNFQRGSAAGQPKEAPTPCCAMVSHGGSILFSKNFRSFEEEKHVSYPNKLTSKIIVHEGHTVSMSMVSILCMYFTYMQRDLKPSKFFSGKLKLST